MPAKSASDGDIKKWLVVCHGWFSSICRSRLYSGTYCFLKVSTHLGKGTVEHEQRSSLWIDP